MGAASASALAAAWGGYFLRGESILLLPVMGSQAGGRHRADPQGCDPSLSALVPLLCWCWVLWSTQGLD